MGLSDTTNRTSFTLVPTPESVSWMSTGEDTSFLVTTTGHLYSCGLNATGELGLNDGINRSSFTLVPTPEPVISVEARLNYGTLIVVVSGQLYVCGTQYPGVENIEIPFTLVDTPEPVVSTTAGIRSFFIVTVSGQVYAQGGNNDGQLGVGDTNNRFRFTPVPLPM